MPRSIARFGRLLAITIFTLGLAGGTLGATPAAAAETALPAWNGGVSLYRSGAFTTQKSWLWCTAAGIQIVHNIVEGAADHSTSAQRRYFDWMRDHNKYDLPESAGVDPQGWTAGLRHFVDDRYELVASSSFEIALRSAARNMRRTNLPVAVTVAEGGHGWILTGFTADVDPATTDSFRVISVRVVGPLYGLQSKNGYDMQPNTQLTASQFKRFFTPWHYDPKPMIWDGLYVSIQPIAAETAPPPAAAASPSPTRPPTPAPTVTPSASPSPSPSPSATPSRTPAAVAIGSSPTASPDRQAAGGAITTATEPGPGLPVAAVIITTIAALVIWRVSRERRPRGRGGPR